MKKSPTAKLPLVWILFVGACLVVGCEPVRHYNRLEIAAFEGEAKSKRKPYGAVQLFQTSEDVKRPYDVIGMMSCEGSAAEEAGIINAMLHRAADMGADGVLLNTAKVGAEEVTGQRIDVRIGWAAMVGSGNKRAYRAQAIRFTE